MSFYSFGFQGVVDTLDYEKYLYSVIYLPAEIAAQLPMQSIALARPMMKTDLTLRFRPLHDLP